MFKITSLRASDGGGAVRIDLKREGEKKPESLYILTAHQKECEFAKGDYPDEAYAVLCRLDGICKIASCMCPAVRICHIRQLFIQQMILLQSICYKEAFIILVKFHRFMVVTPFLVFIYHNGTFCIKFS